MLLSLRVLYMYCRAPCRALSMNLEPSTTESNYLHTLRTMSLCARPHLRMRISSIHEPRYQQTMVIHWRKKTLRSSQDSNLGPLNSGQMLLPMSYWSSGIGAEDRWHLSIDTVRFSGWISLRLGELCMISTEVLCAATSELGKSDTLFTWDCKNYS